MTIKYNYNHNNTILKFYLEIILRAELATELLAELLADLGLPNALLLGTCCNAGVCRGVDRADRSSEVHSDLGLGMFCSFAISAGEYDEFRLPVLVEFNGMIEPLREDG